MNYMTRNDRLSDFCYIVAILFTVLAVFHTISANSEEEENRGKMVKTDSGLEYVVLEEGSGPVAQKGQKVKVHYTGKLEDGTVFDSSVDRGEPIMFTLGVGQVIKGWDEGIEGMKVGEKRQLTIPPDLGYGARGAGNVIPPNSVLIFDTELVEIVE